MTPNAQRLCTAITATLKELDIQVSNVLIGRFGVALDAATEQDATRAADLLRANGAKDIKTEEVDGEWVLVAAL
jgi:hypothetical protein